MSSIIELKNVCKSFDKTEVLHNIDLSIQEGEVVVVIGPSGSGKSTLIRCINCLEIISSGELTVDAIRIPAERRKVRQIRLEVGMVFQQFNLFPHLTALDNVAFGPCKARKMDKTKAVEVARELLGKVGLAAFENKLPGQLSGGQQQRVAIARALMMKPDVLLFDEPTAALDPEITNQVVSIIKELSGTGITQVVVTHEVDFAKKIASHVLYLEKGYIVEHGTNDAFINPQTPEFAEYLTH